ncbi:DUF397 domain-containing protein [Streptantibioticus parmotrematis]|uniref:DUF397 domain-containing protein n=1 Tax=Streptantibioticus parmotrematis TaxID=2873249 RepID=UPI0033C4FFC0
MQPDHTPITARWRKSTYSGGSGGNNCVEVADNSGGVVPVRDSKDPCGPALLFRAEGWTSFVAAIKRGELG